jgi:hypothetical protein
MEAGWKQHTLTMAISLLRARPPERREEALECLLGLDQSIAAFMTREEKREADTGGTENSTSDPVW